jgi:HSP20 family protein
MQSLQERMNRLFDTSFRPNDGDLGSWLPAVDIFEEGDNLKLQAELPGLNEKEIDLQVENNVLTIRGERKRDKEFKEDGYFRAERVFGHFSRSFSLPTTVDSEKIAAAYNNGVLHVTLPKKETSKTRKIQISDN